MTSEQGFARVRGVVRRRRGWVFGTAAVTVVVAGLFVGRAPRVYKAQAVLRALESQPAREYVPPAAAEQVGERLRTLRLAVMARPILEEIVDELHLDRAYRAPRAEVIEGLRQRLEVKVEGDDTYLLSFEDSDPVRAKEVVNRAATAFVERQVERRAAITRATGEALAVEVERLRPMLAARDRAMREFKAAHDGSLPEQQEQNLRALDQATMEINILSTNIDLGEERRRQMMLGALSPMRHQEQVLETALHEALTKYTPDHPEVLRVQAELARVREARAGDEGKLRAGVTVSPELAGLRRELDRQRAQLAELRRRQEEVRARLADTAQNGQALAEMSTELDAIRQKYQAALSKLHDAELAAVVERNLRGQRFDVVEAAAQPLHPVKPDRPLLALVSLVAAALVGLGVGFARDFADPSLHGPEDVLAVARAGGIQGAEVLACVPAVDLSGPPIG